MEQELGPFGRSFLTDEFPSVGTLAMLIIGELVTFMLFGWFLGCFLSILTAFLVGYLCCNVIEPHFNTREGPRDFLNDFDVLSSDFDEKKRQLYKNSGFAEIWDFSGQHISPLFEKSDGPSMSDFDSDETGIAWLKVATMWFAVFLSIYAIAFIGGGIAYTADLDNSQLDLFNEIMAIVYYLSTGVILIVAILLEGKFSYLSSLFNRPALKKAALLVVLVTILDIILVIVYGLIYDSLLGIPDPGDMFFADAGSAGDPLILILIFLTMAVCAPLFEELIFRGYILDSLRSVHPDWIAILASGMMFGAMHYTIFDPSFGFYRIGVTSIGGILYAWLRIRTGSIWPPIICHFIWNGTIFFIEYIY